MKIAGMGAGGCAREGDLSMTVTTLPTGRDFHLGNVFNRAKSVLGANFSFFFLVGLIVSLPQGIVDIVSGNDRWLEAGAWWLVLVALLVWPVVTTIGQAVILFGAFQYQRGEPVRAGEAFTRGLARFFPLLGVTILYTLGVFFAAMLFLVPGGILMVCWAVVVPVCVVEGLGPTKSLSRSTSLTRGNRWEVFGALVLMWIVNAIALALLAAAVAPFSLYAGAVASLLWTACWYAFWHCFTVMMYYELRVAKEGIDVSQIAAVFD
jgi:hypothetical protein